MKVILASSSPRRIQLFKNIFSDFLVVKPNFNESSLPLNTPHYALEESQNKAFSIKNNFSNEDLIIACDTIVYLKNKIYGKPKNIDEAMAFFNDFNNKTHQVISGYTILYQSKIIKKEVTSQVKFKNLNAVEIKKYLSNHERKDKAGGYGIQDEDSNLIIEKFDGSFNNIIGFPLEEIKKDLILLHVI